MPSSRALTYHVVIPQLHPPLDEIPASQAGAVFLAGGLGILTVSALFVGELDINATDADFPHP